MEELLNTLWQDDCFQVIDCEDNENWQWVEVEVVDHDTVGMSEVLSNHMKQAGFQFCALGERPDSVRFNRKKEDN